MYDDLVKNLKPLSTEHEGLTWTTDHEKICSVPQEKEGSDILSLQPGFLI
jgi:hypothetical protein